VAHLVAACRGVRPVAACRGVRPENFPAEACLDSHPADDPGA
jgi:hypothetical protein